MAEEKDTIEDIKETGEDESSNDAGSGETYIASGETETADSVADTEEEEEAVLEFDVMMSSGVLYDYLLRHSYSSAVGLLGSCFGAFGIIMFFCYGGWLYLIMGIIVLVYLPVTLFKRSKMVMLTNPAYKQPLKYRFTEKGYTVSQEEARSSVEWSGCRKAISTKKSIIIYTGKNNASIFPREQIPGGASALIGVIARYMEPKRIKIRY